MKSSTLKTRLLPPSSASFHDFETKVLDHLYRLEELNRQKLRQDTESNQQLNQQLQILSTRLSILQTQVDLYAGALSRLNTSESAFDTRLRLFRNLLPATGQMHYCQQVTSRLMRVLSEILEQNQIEYWFGYGSLLGAYTRGGPIPWDDDIDICIHRQGLQKLIQVLQSNPDYQVTKIYDGCVNCIQYRFCSKDFYLPAFIDLGVWDYATEYSQELDERLRQLRLDFSEALNQAKLPYWRERQLLFPQGSDYIISAVQLAQPRTQDVRLAQKEMDTIDDLLEQYLQRAYDEGIFCNKKDAQAYAYSIDNLYLNLKRQMIYKKSLIHPTISMFYDGFHVRCPRDTVAFLDTLYHDWPYIPNNDSLLGNRHFDTALLDLTEVKEAMTRFLERTEK